jgi:FkbM family methyltransferase
MDPSRLAFNHVRVAGSPPVEFCLDPYAGDAVAAWLLEHDWIDEPVMRAFLGLVGPGTRVIDLGCHLGTFSLPAAALGAEVIAVDASARHVHLLRMAARRNGFASLHAIHGAVSDGSHPVQFIERSIHGRVWLENEPDQPTTTVPTVSVDELVEQLGWDAVDAIKLDIEGSEPAALRGMRRLHSRGIRPAMVFECNGSTLPLFGSSTRDLRQTIAELGYELMLIDHLRAGTLVEADADTVQPECASDYLALFSRPPRLDRDWTIEPPFSREQIVTRLLDSAVGESAGFRRYAADVLAGGPEWLRSGLAVPTVPGDTVVSATDVSAGIPSDEPERPGGAGQANLGKFAFRGLSFHLRHGESLALVAEHSEAGSALVRLLGGFERAVKGELTIRGRAALVSPVLEVFEPDLGIGDNLMLFASFLGCDVRTVAPRLVELAGRAGVGHPLATPFGQMTRETQMRLALTVAVECAEHRLLVLDRLPIIGDAAFRRWFAGRIAEIRRGGTAVIQVVCEPGQLLAPADRMLWIERGNVHVRLDRDAAPEGRRDSRSGARTGIGRR